VPRRPDRVEIDLLGGFAVRVGGQPVPDGAWARRHPAALVKLLALSPGHRLHREQVIDLLWPEVPVPDAAPRLHKAAHYARSALGLADGVVLRGEQVRLLPGAEVVVDAARFEQAAQAALADGSEAAAERVLQSYAGDLLPAEPYDEWLASARERLRALRQRLLRQARRWTDLLADDPLDETAHLEVLKDLVKAGERTRALQHYQQLAEAFRTELGVDPPPALQRIHRGLRATAVATERSPAPVREGLDGSDAAREAAPARPVRIPAPLRGRLIGRDADLTALEQLMADYRCVTISGPGGAGKSTLALTVAHRVVDRGGEVLVAELAPAQDGPALLRTVAEVAGVEGAAAREVTALASLLGRRRVTLVLDNCEHLIGACAELADALLEAGQGIRLLTTSREPLGIDGEAVRRLGSLGDSAAELFVERARAVAGDLELSATDPRVVHLCERLDGLPLAIELAAAQLPHLSLDELGARVDDRLRLLVRERPRAGRRHSTLGAAIEGSYQLLDEPARRVFERLGVFPADFDLAAAQAVAAMPDGATTALVVRDLVAKSLLVHEPARGRYRYLETIRIFAREHLESSGLLDETTELLRRHVVHRSTGLPRHRRWLSSTGAAAARADIANVRLAFWASQQRGDLTGAVDVALGLSTLWRNAMSFAEGLEWVTALGRTDLSDEDRMWVALLRADLGLGSGRHRIIREAAAEAREVAERLGQPHARLIAAMYQALLDPDRPRSAGTFRTLAREARDLGEPQLERLLLAFRLVALMLTDGLTGVADEAEALVRHPDAGHDYDRYICLWLAWVTALIARDGTRLRSLMDGQVADVRATGLPENWLMTLSEAFTRIGEGTDYLGQLAAARGRAEAEGRAAEAECVLTLAYAAACAGEAERAAELIGACQDRLVRDTAGNVTMIVVRDHVVRPLLAPDVFASALERGAGLSPSDLLAGHGL
jgi:predicted ATPase/DNA-binding SARP family transcriptional activator